jgi:Flp pilus assembly protein TadD
MPDDFASAVAAFETGKTGEAIERTNALLSKDPRNIQALTLCGAAHARQGDLAEAARCFEKAVEVQPLSPQLLNNLAGIYIDLEKFDEAEALCEKSIAVQPTSAAYNHWASSCLRSKRHDDAEALFEKALALDPENLAARNNYGLCLLSNDALRAEEQFRMVLGKNATYLPALNHLGIALMTQGKLSEAEQVLRQAVNQDPKGQDAIANLALLQRWQGKMGESVALFRKLVALNPSRAESRHNFALALLAAGNFAEGWKEYESRWEIHQGKVNARSFAQPEWRGEEGNGKTLLIYAEQGFGDTIQFCRYAPLAAAHGWRVVLEVQKSLARLCKSLGVETIGKGEALPEFHAHIPLLSLPRLFETTLDNIPVRIPYLKADPQDVERIRAQTPTNGALRVGLAWTGNQDHSDFDLAEADRRRTLPLPLLKDLVSISGAHFFSLQKEGSDVARELGLTDLMGACRDFGDTAALVETLDLVISADTSVVHLAGAMGKPVWVMNRIDGCWRWLMDRDDSPWYPSLRLFRQKSFGDWENVIDRVKAELKKSIETAN